MFGTRMLLALALASAQSVAGAACSVNSLIVRADLAVSEEEFKVQMMVAQPFPAL